jgi:FAD dependent oxidoreductase TIGR03364
MTQLRDKFDLAVVGAGILGLSCALAAARRELRVVVIERDKRAQKASVLNFGFITVTGQGREGVWNRARRSRDVWEEVAGKAGIRILQRGQWIAAQRPESAAVLEAFMCTDMAEGCELITPATAQQRCPNLRTSGLQAVLCSPHELRVESRDAIPMLADWLASDYGVRFRWETAVHAVAPPKVETSRGLVLADMAVVCPGDDLVTLFPDHLAGIGRCALQMLRLESPGFELPGTVMSDLSLIRYGGFASLPEASVLRRQLESEQGELLQNGIHLIVAQGSDGSLVVGDSHHYAFADETLKGACASDRLSARPAVEISHCATERIYGLLLDEYTAVVGQPPPAVRQRWIGTYAAANDRVVLIEAPAPDVRLVVVTSGIGASIGFAIGEEVISNLFD